MEPGVAGAAEHFLRLDDPHDLGSAWIGLGVKDVNARGTEAGHNQVSTFDVRMGRVRTKGRTAGIPAEVVQLIAWVGHFYLTDDLAVGGRARSQIHHGHRIGPSILLRIENRNVSEVLSRGLHCQPRRWTKSP